MKARLVTHFVGAALAVVGSASFAQSVHYPTGKSLFEARCAVCHQAGGKGQDGLAPPLTEYPGTYAGLPDGRRQLGATVLNGMFGEITVHDKTYNFKMPSFASAGDDDLAQILNYVVFDLNRQHGAAKPFSAVEIKAARTPAIDGSAVHAQRAVLTKALGLQ
jgi:mono/diheme cytochrome c family protein